MLIEFSVENFMSIKDEARLSLAAGPGKEHRETHVMTPEMNEGVRSIPLVRSAAIYGANAAGKTNLLLALGAMRHFIVESARELRVRSITPFRFARRAKRSRRHSRSSGSRIGRGFNTASPQSETS